MGDRTIVELTIIAEHAERAKLIWGKYEEGAEVLDVISNGEHISNLIVIRFEGVNYGELPFLEELVNSGIPYNSDWGGGGEYHPGADYFRIDENGTHFHTLIGDDSQVNRVDTSQITKICSDDNLSDGEKVKRLGSLAQEVEAESSPPFSLCENRAILGII